jgi:hypothetical protein
MRIPQKSVCRIELSVGRCSREFKILRRRRWGVIGGVAWESEKLCIGVNRGKIRYLVAEVLFSAYREIEDIKLQQSIQSLKLHALNLHSIMIAQEYYHPTLL